MGEATFRCPFCEGEISASAKKCRHCGEWIQSPPPAPAPPPVPAPAQPPSGSAGSSAHASVVVSQTPAHIHVARPPESVAFAVVTLIFYFLAWPIGFLLNFIGLITGPRRGCFLSMFIVFLVLPVVVILIIVAADPQAWQEFWDAFEREMS